MLKLVVTKGQAEKIAKDQLDEAIALLKRFPPQFFPLADSVMGKLDIHHDHQVYAQVVHECVEVSCLNTPVNFSSPPGSAKAIKQ